MGRKDDTMEIDELNDSEAEKANSEADSEFPTYVLNDPDIDRGWAWVALFSSFSTMVLIGLTAPMIGIMYIYQLEAFGKSPTLTACIGSLMNAALNMCGPVAGWIATRYSRRLGVMVGGLIGSVSLAVSSQSYNFWLVLVTNGLIAGFSIGLGGATAYINIGCYFIRRRAFASGIIMMGYPIGVFLSPPIIQYLEYIYGWRGAILLIAGIQLNHCVMGALLKRTAIEKYHGRRQIEVPVKNKEHSSSNILPTKPVHQSVYKNISFWFLSISFLFTTCTIMVVYVHLPRYIYTLGGTAVDIQMLYLALGLSGAISRALTGLGSGTVKNGISLDNISLLLGSFSIVGATLLIFPPLAHNQSYRLLCMCLVGFYYNVEPVLYVPVIMTTVGFPNLGDALGLILLFCGVGYLIGPPLAAYVVTETQQYDNAFYMAGGLNFVAVLSLATMVLLKTNTTKKTAISTIHTNSASKDIYLNKMGDAQEVNV